ncbi:DNA-directed RNA polymerase III subunit [Actinomortierella ambigua]|nr:DNA-directed RNA polymerase III subunit [Actinomortierella ambigua]
MKEQVVDQAPKKIKQIQFGVLSPQEIVQVSEFEVTQRDLYTVQDRQPVKYGMLDLRLGTSDKQATCETCGLKQQDCIGHFAHIRLCLPVFHIGYFRAAIVILQNICKTCSRVLLSEKDRRKYLRRLRAPRLENLTRKNVCKAINTECKKVTHCPYCSAINGTVKKVGALRIVHEKYRAKRVQDEKEQFLDSFKAAIAATPEIKVHVGKAHEDMNPLRVLNLFKAISDEDCELLGMNPDLGRPESYLWQNISVPPVCIRPSVQQDGASNEDDITVKLTEVIFTNAHMQAGLEKGIAVHSLMEQWEFLQLSVAMYINSELPGLSNLMPGKPVRGFVQRLKGKQGRFRGNLSGKRVDFSGRTVISPDPNLRIDQVAVPELVAKNLTYPERVTEHNIERLRRAIKNGTEVHPGANYVTLGSTGMKRSLKFGNRSQLAQDLQIGDVVERHLHDNDVVLFNRQPSLHKLSIMAHFAKIRPWRTFRFNECVCNPYNADFDGDEMNLHVPQTEEARTEAIELMGVKNNLVTPRNGTPLIAAIQDFITASYLITQKDLFFDRAQFVQICAYLGDAELKIDIPPPAIIKPAQRWTGKQIISVLLRPNKESNIFVNLEAKTRSYDKVKRPVMDMCRNDGYLVIYNSEIMCGVLDKSIVGDGNKSSLFYIVLRDYGPIEAAKCMNRLAKLCARWLGTVGFSIGINDVQPGEVLAMKKDDLVKASYAHCDELIAKSAAGQLENQPGCDVEQTLEALISGELSQVRDKVGDICLTELNKYNSPLIMATCGSKGSKINVSQMVACVGQQIISGKRIPNGFQDRSLPHFLKHSKVPPAKGFVRNSFYSGLTPTEFFFHAVSGREGLVDTAVKTAETGYMQRRLMKAFEDLTTHYDLSVRNSEGSVVQFKYGSDGLDPAVLEGNGIPVLFDRNFTNTLHILPLSETDKILLPWQIMAHSEKVLASPKWSKNCSEEFIEATRMFVRDKIAGRLKDLRVAYDMMSGEHNPGEEYEDMDMDEFVDPAIRKIVNNKLAVTERHMDRFLNVCWDKFMKAKIEPASAVGAVGAQSIGEPGTQMTLKTFHFAGVASMNITLGVPRIKEIINAAKVINTPIITTRLVNNTDLKAARIVKGRIEKTMLGDIAEWVEEVYKPDECYLGVRLDMDAIRRLQLETDLDEVAKAIGRDRKLKIGHENVQSHKPDRLRIYVKDTGKGDLYYSIKNLKRALPDVIVKGLPQVNRAVINEIQGSGGKKELLVEGYGLRDLMNTEGVVGTMTRSNHVMEVWKVLGIEAARRTILDEIKSVMDSHGLTIDPRHVMLLGDIMTSKGEVLGITRFGIAKMKDSVMMLASFEKTTDHLFEAALYSKKDAIEGVSECIIMGIPMTIGTGLFKLIKRDEATRDRIPARRKLLFDA